MALFFKHDIAAWMDGTEHLDDGPYRVYHVVCQLIYFNEGPIRINENGLAGRCKQSVRAFRANLSKLVELGLLSSSEGRLSNSRTEKELEKIGENRLNASKGGKARSKPLKNNDAPQAPLPEQPALRLDKTRLEKKDGADAPLDLKKQFWDRGIEILGNTGTARGLIGRLAKAKGEDWALARAALETASTKVNPRSYIAGICNMSSGAPRTGDEYTII